MIWKKQHIPNSIPSEIEFYHSLFHAEFQQSDDEYIVFDCETTGLNPSKDSILSIGAVAISGNHIDAESAFHEFVFQPDYKGEAAPVHGIGYDQIQNARTEQEVVADFLRFVGNRSLIGHHVGFDFKIVENAMRHHWSYPLRNKQLDTVQLVKEVLPSHHKSKTLPSNHFSLDYLCNLFKIPIEDRHTALGDAYLTAILFLRLTSEISPSKLSSLFH